MGKQRKVDTVTGNKVSKLDKLQQKAPPKKEWAIDPEKIIERDVYHGQEKSYEPLPLDYFEPFDDYIDPMFSRSGQYSLKDLNAMRADNQSTGEQFRNGLGRLAVNIVPQIMAGFGSMLDVQGYFDAEHAVSNSLVEWAQDVKDWSNEAMPIYLQDPERRMAIDDPAWWISNGFGVVESIAAFAAQGVGAGKIASASMKGLGAAVRGKDIFKAILGKGGAAASKKALTGSKYLLSSVMLNQSEATIEAAQVYDEIYNTSLQKGENIKDARQKAAEAAATTMRLNRINILLNLTSAAAFVKPSSFTRQLLKAPSLKRNLGGLAFEGGQEAMEELINHVASQAGIAKGEGREYTFQDALNDMGSMEGFEAAFLGALGGIGQTGGTNLLRRSKYGAASTRDEDGNRISAFESERRRYEKQQQVINELKEQGVKVTDSLKGIKDQIVFGEKVMNAETQEEIEELRGQLFEEQALKAFQSGTTEILEELYKAEAAKDPEEVGQEHIDRANQASKDLKELEAVYNNHEDFVNVGEIYHNRANKIRNARMMNELKTEHSRNYNEYSSLVQSIAKKYQVNREKEVVFKKDGEETGRETRTEKTPLNYNLDSITENPETTSENQAIYNQFLKEVQELPQYDKHIQGEINIDEYNKRDINFEKQYKEITDKKYQEKFKSKQAKEKLIKESEEFLDKTDSIADIEKLKARTQDKEFSKKADAKIAELQQNQRKQKQKKKRDIEVKAFKNKIAKASKENIEALKEEIEKAELSEKDKKDLIQELGRKFDELENPNTTGTPLSEMGYEDTDPEEQAAATKKDEENEATEIPKAIPNVNTEGERVAEEVAAAAAKTHEEKPHAVEEDENGFLIYDYARTTEGHNRAAYLSRELRQTKDGIVVSREEITDDIENQQVLDPDKLLPGTELTLEVEDDYVGEKYDPTTDTREIISWTTREAELKEKHGENYRTSQEYIDEVPIKVSTKDGTRVFYIHDTAWIRQENVSATEEELEIDKAKLRAIRSQVIAKGQVKTKVTYKGNGRLMKTSKGKPMSALEAMPDSNLVIAVAQDEGQGADFKYDTSKKLQGGKEGVIKAFTPNEGSTYALVPIGKDQTMPIPLKRKTLSSEVVDSAITALEIYIKQDKDHPLVAEIGNSSLGVDITTINGIRAFLKQFMYLYPTDGTLSFATIVAKKNEEIKHLSNVNMVTVTGNSIEIGRPGVNMSGNSKSSSNAMSISLNFKEEENLAKLKTFRKHFEGLLSNTNLDMVQSSEAEAVMIDENGNLKTVPYTEYVKDSHETEVFSVNIGTEEDPKYVYTLQPTINYDTSFIDGDAIKKEVKKKRKEAELDSQQTTEISSLVGKKKTKQSVTAAADIEAKREELRKQKVDIEKSLGDSTERWLSSVFDTMQVRLANPSSPESKTRLQEAYKNKEAFIRRIGNELSPMLSEETKNKLIPNFRNKYPELVSDLSKGLAETTFYEDLANAFLELVDINKIDSKYDAELTALKGQPTADTRAQEAEIERIWRGWGEESKAWKKTIEPEYEEGDYLKVYSLAHKQVNQGKKGVTAPDMSTPANLQLISNYPKLFEEAIKTIEAKNKTLEKSNKEKLLAGKENIVPIYGINATVNDATGKLDIEWVKIGEDNLTDPKIFEIGTFYFDQLLNYEEEINAKYEAELAALEGQATTQTQAEIIDRSSIPENVISIEVPDPLSNFIVSFTDEAGKKREVFVAKDAQENPYIKLNNPPTDNKGRRPNRATVDALARKYLGDGLVDFMLDWKALSKEDESIIQQHVLGVTSRGNLDSEFYNPPTIEEINEQYENRISSEIKEGVDKYLKPFAQESLEETVQKLEREYEKLKVEKSKTKTKIVIDDYKKALSRFGTTQPTTEQKVGDTAVREENAKALAKKYSVETLEGVIENLNAEKVDLPKGTDSKEVLATYKRALEIKKEAQKNSSKFQDSFFDVDVDETTEDDADEEDAIDDALPLIVDKEKKELDSSVENLVIRGVDSQNREALLSLLTAEIIDQSLRNKTVDTKAIFDKFEGSLENLANFYESKGLVNKARKVRAFLSQYDKVKALTKEKLNLITTGKVQDSENESESQLVKEVYKDDWTFTVDPKSTASANLKKFFSTISEVNPDGTIRKSSLGIEMYVPFDKVYTDLQELLAGKSPNFETAITVLELHVDKKPWLNSVIDKLESAPESIKNEFVSNMAKHHVNMDFIMWTKAKDGTFKLTRWNSNSASVQHRLRHSWNSNMKGRTMTTNLVYPDDSGTYRFNKEYANRLIAQADEWAKDPSTVSTEDLAIWLANFGITLSPETLEDIKSGYYRNGATKVKWESIFSSKFSFVTILKNKIKNNLDSGEGDGLSAPVENVEVMNDSSVKALAKLEASNISNVFSNSFNAGGKTIWSYTNNHFLANRVNDLLDPDSELAKHLKGISFTKDSAWLEELNSQDEALQNHMKNTFGFSYVSLEALKKLFTPSKDNRKLNNLTAQEHEVTKINMFFAGGGKKFGGETRRTVGFFHPTMSDKTTMAVLNTLSRELNANFHTKGLSKKNLEALYNSIVLPELNRIASNNQAKTVEGYEPNHFYFLTALNDPIIINGEEKSLVGLARNGQAFTPEVNEAIYRVIEDTFNSLLEQKLEDWNRLGIGNFSSETNEKYTFINHEYIKTIAKGGTAEAKVRFAAADFIFNSLIANAEAHVLFAGDPALYAKTNEDDTVNNAKTNSNIGKRLAGNIAPGIELADSANNEYTQVFFDDTEMESNNVKDSIQEEYFSKIIPDFKKNYSGIEGADAQEYTTWKEHLYVMQKLGRLTKDQHDKISSKLENNKKLTYDELGLILQPVKPVYVGNIASTKENVDRRVYIKSSSFPLIPQLTKGLEIDKIRIALEGYEKESGKTVRASFNSGNKVGAIKNSIKVFEKDGTVKKGLKVTSDNTLTLQRKNFRIQQDVPYKREKDSVNIGTQERKLLFVNTLDTQVTDTETGTDLMRAYNEHYENLFVEAQAKLAARLGLVEVSEGSLDISGLLVIPETTIFEDVEEAEKEELSEQEQKRKDFINNNFNDIVEKLIESKVNVFFKDEEGNHKDCTD